MIMDCCMYISRVPIAIHSSASRCDRAAIQICRFPLLAFTFVSSLICCGCLCSCVVVCMCSHMCVYAYNRYTLGKLSYSMLFRTSIMSTEFIII